MLKYFLTVLCLAWISNAMPLAKRLVDMTYTLENNNFRYPGMKPFKIDNLVNGSVEEFKGLWLQMEEYSSGTHVGTHMDAPSHFIKGAINVDEIPLTEFFAPAAVIDITAKVELDVDAEVTTEDLLQWESSTGQNLNGTIVLLRFDWGRRWNDHTAYYGTPEDEMDTLHFPGLAPEASQWLVDNRSIKGIGTEALSIDNGPSRSYQSHLTLLGHGLYILENVANIDKLPIYGAKLYVFPTKIGKGSGAPTRIIASIPIVI